MVGAPFRFIHAGEFHLEQPLCGLSGVPDHLRDALIDAPYAAAEQVFQAALSEGVQFVVLSGDLLNPHAAGPRGLAFLVAQFERLAERNIAVYWAGGQVDPPGRWPSPVVLPPNVHVFPKGKVEEVTHRHDGEPLATVMGTSVVRLRRIRAADFQRDPNGLFSVAVAYGHGDPESLARRGIHYWALGGAHRRRTLYAEQHAAQYCGTHQGRYPEETGPRGCTLVSVDQHAGIRSQFIPTDAGRWHHERIDLPEEATRSDLERLLRDRMQSLAANSGDRFLLVQWTVACSRQIAALLRHGHLASELAGWLRNEFGHGSPAAWTVRLQAETAAAIPSSWYEEDTILGDFLGAVRSHQDDDGQGLDLATLMSDRHAAGLLGSATQLTDPAARRRVLGKVAALGVDLLRGEEPAEADGNMPPLGIGGEEMPT